jgi:hypothetical protein
MALDLESIFSHHPPLNSETRVAHEDARAVCFNAANEFELLLPDSPEKTLAIRRLQEAMMYANSAIAQYS